MSKPQLIASVRSDENGSLVSIWCLFLDGTSETGRVQIDSIEYG